jgi:hypothetical protein
MAKAKKAEVIVYPEIIVGSRPDGNSERWTVTEGFTERGQAWTDFTNKHIQVPLINDEVAQAVRTHELIHAKVSPVDPVAVQAWAENNGLDADVVMSAEEVRVNAISKKLGYNTDLLLDGSEKETGKRLAKEGSEKAYDMMIKGGGALLGTKAFRQFITGVRSVNKDWATDLREMEKEVTKVIKNNNANNLAHSGSRTIQDDNGNAVGQLPYGFERYTGAIANIISGYLKQGGDVSESNNSGIEMPTGKDAWAKLIISNVVKLDKQVKGHLARRKKASPIGKRIAYPSRLLTDPEKRIFSQKPRNSGGVVLLDLSGSMSLSIEQIEKMVDTAPGALIMGYSANRNKSKQPNAWILADRGKRVSSLNGIPYGYGNGVDGPALDWAIGKRRGSEPVIWVTDGMVTGSGDGFYEAGAEACAKLIKKHRVLVTPNTDEAVEMLKAPKASKSRVFGFVGMHLTKAQGGTNGKLERV